MVVFLTGKYNDADYGWLREEHYNFSRCTLDEALDGMHHYAGLLCWLSSHGERSSKFNTKKTLRSMLEIFPL
jgi:hypothetical protein